MGNFSINYVLLSSTTIFCLSFEINVWNAIPWFWTAAFYAVSMLPLFTLYMLTKENLPSHNYYFYYYDISNYLKANDESMLSSLITLTVH